MRYSVILFILFAFIYSCSKKESTPSVTPPVVIKLSGCDSIKQGLLKTTSDTVRLVSCLTISSCDSIRLGILKPNNQDTIRLLSCIKITGCDSVRLGVLKPNTQDTLRLLSCIKITGCDSVRLGLLKSTKDLLRLGCYSLSTTIGKQQWMIVNLDVETYRNGDTIPQVTDIAAWDALTTGAWCYYKNDAAYGAIYGKLYNWYAVNDLRGLAPQGWHIPTDSEWTTLSNFLGDNAGNKMKTTGDKGGPAGGWNYGSQGTNESGFSGLPGGSRGDYKGVGTFSDNTFSGNWWSATEYIISYPKQAWKRSLYYNSGVLFSNGPNIKANGYSVRCVKD
jgi:uncharacterized protein (TIGR02145 family)